MENKGREPLVWPKFSPPRWLCCESWSFFFEKKKKHCFCCFALQKWIFVSHLFLVSYKNAVFLVLCFFLFFSLFDSVKKETKETKIHHRKMCVMFFPFFFVFLVFFFTKKRKRKNKEKRPKTTVSLYSLFYKKQRVPFSHIKRKKR